MSQAEPGYHGPFMAYMSRSNVDEKYTEALETLYADRDRLNLAQATSCLAIGAGAGMNEIRFVKRLMPNLRSFTIVEPDGPSIALLKQNLQRHLPNVNAVVHQTTAEVFVDAGKNDGESYDVVFLFRVMYFIARETRSAFIRKLSEGFLRDSGCMLVNSESRTDHPECLYKLLDQLQPRRHFPSCDELVHYFSEAGLSLSHQCDYAYTIDISQPDEILLKFVSTCVDRPVEMDELCEAIRTVLPQGKTDNVFFSIRMFKEVQS